METYLATDGTKFGWQAAIANTSNPDLEDYRRNGKYCASGLAYESAKGEATCVSTSQVVFNGKVLDDTYGCDPMDPDVKCYIKFDTSSSTPAWLA